MKILMTGATGLVGRELGKSLVRAGHELVVISRDRVSARRDCPFPCEIVEGDLVAAPVSSHHLDEVEGVVHLMGEPIAKGRWTEAKKNRLVESRVRATKNLRLSLGGRAQVLVSTSAVGFYGDRGDEILTEESAGGEDFLAGLCRKWEEAADEFSREKTRVVKLRLGMVISNRGGALCEMLTPARVGVAGPIGGGRQWMSWVHLEDVVRIFERALTDADMQGVYNVVAPEAVRNQQFMSQLNDVLHRPGLLPVPATGLKVLFGEMSEVLLSSQQVKPQRLHEIGYRFRFSRLEESLNHELGHLSDGEDLYVAEQYIDIPKEELFPFFAEADNLGRLTPPFLDFRVQSVSDAEIQEGTMIHYRLKIHGVPVTWQTRIEEWTPPHRFVDNQLKGPYRLWHHTHSFEDFGSGTLMTDRVRYRLPLGYIGWLTAGALVRSDIEKIFSFRREVIDTLFGRPVSEIAVSSRSAEV